MSSLTSAEKLYFEKLFGMQSGYVLDFNDATYGEFFNAKGVDIHAIQYQTYGTSKAKKLRSFWEQMPDDKVGSVLGDMLDLYEATHHLSGHPVDVLALEKARCIVHRLLPVSSSDSPSEGDSNFLDIEFSLPDIRNLPIEPLAVPIIESRLNEVRLAMGAGAYLSTIFLCGSVLEGVLLGLAQKYPKKFNQASASPKVMDKRVRPLHEWTLSQFIDVACEVGFLKPDVKKFSHGLRDFRNYIHPYEQMASRFSPDEHTARVCIQVLKAALASVAGTRL